MRNRGFTLVELMVTIAIVAILLAIGLPSFQGTMRSNRVATATNELVGALSLARSEALRSPGGALVCTTSDGSDCDGTSWDDGWMVWLDWNGDEKIDDPKDRLLRYVEGNDKLQIVAESDGGVTYENMILFDSRGRTKDHSVDLTVQPVDCPTGHDLVRTIEITATGQVRMEKSACT
ncbi:GspH/FimT family pseudopilin [Luteimonas salinilitoris]|uniref:Type II secretion system protein H n=1 Tax=Luteimonas salinilitoris TaxID=3237697 RepID=A0ABV4HUA8_9GAMM